MNNAIGLAVAAVTALAAPALAQDQPPVWRSELVASFAIPEAHQGVGVDDQFFYAVANTTIAKYDKATGALVDRWDEDPGGGIIHLDSAVLVDGRLYAAHSNYPGWPMTSSVEVWDAATLDHVDSHSFGIDRGSLTWLDHHDGSWWGTFGTYNQAFALGVPAQGNSGTQIVRFDDQWRVAEAWVIPQPVLARFGNMSNSGGSWGPDGRLFITGHDLAEAYVMELPERGSVLEWVATVPLENTGQGIAWDRSQPDILYAIIRSGENRVTVNRVISPEP